MKKAIVLLVMLVIATPAFAGMEARTGVNGSLHDMNVFVGAGADTYGRVCVFCHTPHNATAMSDSITAPLWNHQETAAVFDPYIWATPENSDLLIFDPLEGPSRLCMSCHDGVIAVDQHNGSVSQLGSTVLSGAARGNIGNSAAASGLSDDHPIGFDYDEALDARNVADGTGIGLKAELVPKTEFFATAVDTNQAAGTYNNVTREGTRQIQDVLYDGYLMTCASCHEVHNKENVIQLAGSNLVTPNYFLYGLESESLICLSCHIK
jgi:hypothetical protein